jgi:glycosyltransferase involved in cell wall biosynthesis
VLEAAHDADAVLALDPVSIGLPAMRAAKRLRKKFVVKIVGDYAWEQGRQRFGVTQELDDFVKTKQPSWSVRRLQAVEKEVATGADRVIVPSEYLKRVVSAWGVSAEKISVIYNSIELPDALPEVSRNPEEFLIVSSGRRVPWKGFEAIERVAAKRPGWRVHIASGVSREEALAWTKAADVYVLNSEYEGLSHALIEAMMLGTPVIATSAGGNTELIRDGVNGFLIAPKDDAALQRALRAVEQDPAGARMRADAARERIGMFGLARMLDTTADFLKTL